MRRRDDDALSELLRLRPDLLQPVPADFTALTSRATAGPSVARCLDTVDALDLHVLRVVAEATAQTPHTRDHLTVLAIAGLPDSAETAVGTALDGLITRALLWGDDDALRVIGTVPDLVAGFPVPPWPPASTADATSVDQASVDGQSGLHARETLALLRDLLEAWSVQPPAVLRSGGLALRDFATAGDLMHADPARTALLIEVAAAARLLADDEEEDPHWVPTEHYDTWTARPPAEQWVEIVEAWLALPRLPGLSTEKSKLLVAENDRRPVPGMRRDLLTLLGELPSGSALSAEQIKDVLDHRRPRRAGVLREQVIRATLREATDLGVLAMGALSSASRLLLSASPADAADRRRLAAEVAETMAATMPDDVDHVLIQADLTITAPGPLTATIGRTLGLMATIESRGHATVYRVDEASVRRALDAGWDAEGLHGFLSEISRTPVPQPLTYLIDDVARRHGAVRVGGALSYLRSDAADTLRAIAQDHRLKALGLHRIADTVVICQAPPSEVITELRKAGYAPAAESPDGGIVVRRPEDHRTRTPRAATARGPRSPEPALVTAAVRTLRAGDRTRTSRGSTVSGPAAAGTVPRLQSGAVVSALRGALEENASVWIGYADTDGTVGEQIVDPIRLSAGVLTAFDHRTDGVRTFSVSRITGVADLSAP